MGNPWKTLRVDLTNRTWQVEERPEQNVRLLPGGRSFGAYQLLKDVPSGADPLGPENELILAGGVLTGCKFSGANRFSALAKSPLTDGYGEGEAGGWWGPELVASGFDAVILQGQADSPVYLCLENGQVAIRDAKELWGLPNDQAYDRLRRDHPGARVAQVGPAGERGVRYAHIVNELRHANGRSGLGAVMGSKKVKAIVVRGTGGRVAANPEALEALHRWHNSLLMQSFYGKYFREHGTVAGLEYQNVTGGLPTRNFQQMTFSHAAEIGDAALTKDFLDGHGTCYACVLRCKPVIHLPGPEAVDRKLGGPEYETLAALGSLCGVSDLGAVVQANALLNQLGLDSISTGNCIAFAMECYEKGVLSAADTDGLDLRFGNAEGMLEMIRRIACREGLGDLLAEGVQRAAAKIGKGAESFALQTKGQEFPMHDPRGKVSQALAYAVSPTGADHNTSPFDDMYAKKGSYLKQAASLGILEPVPETSLGPDKVRLYTYLHHLRSLYNSLLLCMFVADPTTPLNLPKITELVRAVTGWDVSEWELMKAGERGTTLARLFNVRQGKTSADDALPSRMFEAVPEGPKAGRVVDRGELQQAVTWYYGMMGWDSQGVPTPGKLVELGLGNLVNQ